MMTETIREAIPQDIPAIVEMGREFLHNGPYKDQTDNPSQAIRFASQILMNPQAKILVSECNGELTGVLGFLLFDHYYTGDLTAHELIWYVKPECRAGGTAVRLFAESERIAKSMGALRMQFTAPTPEVGSLYKRYGYRLVEVGYERSL